jgi:hypothetical protein
MNRLSRAALAALALLLSAGASPARAQTIPSPFRYIQHNQSLSAFGGYLWTDPMVALSDSTEAELGARSAPVFGVRYGLRFGGPLSGDVALAFIPSERKVFLAQVNADSTEITPVFTGNTASAPLLMLEGSLRFHLTGDRTWNGLAPFVAVTGGLVSEVGGTDPAETDLTNAERFDFGPAFAVGGAAGLDWFVSDRFSLRVDVSGRLWRESPPQGLQPPGSRRETEWSPVTGVSLGGAFHF